MPQNPELQKPTPPSGQILTPLLLQSTYTRNATLFRSKHDERSVDTITEDSSPMIDQGSMLDGKLWPPDSKPESSF